MRLNLKYKDHDIFLIPSKNGTYLFYAPTLRLLIRIKNHLADKLSLIDLKSKNLNKDVVYITELLEKSFENIVIPFPIQNRKSRYFHLALGLTKNCTLNCLYCHANAGKEEDMPDEIVVNSIKYAFKTARKEKLEEVNISFAVGGEPTTKWNKFKKCIRTVKEYEKKYSMKAFLSMTTNGYYGNVKRNFIAENFNSILLSLDGTPDIQNLHRPNKAMKDSFNSVIESAKYFIKKTKSFSIRVTVSNYSVARMEEIVDFFYNELGCNYDLVFEPLVPLGRANDYKNTISEPTQEDFVKYYLQAKERCNELGIKISTSAANQKRLVTGFCGAMTIPSFTVTTNGILTTCERDSEGDNYWYGKYSSSKKDFIINNERVEYNKSLVIIPDKCNDCYCKWHCAGDCPDVRTINYDRCYVNKSLIQYELESLLK